MGDTLSNAFANALLILVASAIIFAVWNLAVVEIFVGVKVMTALSAVILGIFWFVIHVLYLHDLCVRK